MKFNEKGIHSIDASSACRSAQLISLASKVLYHLNYVMTDEPGSSGDEDSLSALILGLEAINTR